ncbi:MAG: SIMPL domain-containing protein [Pseudomonadales bacterium]|nr:SIMPL domain-containing protein [Pseudomonadales bacterium]
MKLCLHKLSVSLLFASCLSWSQTLLADDKSILVSGKAVEKAPVDTLNWQIRLNAEDRDADDCKAKIDRQAQSVIQALQTLYDEQHEYRRSTFSNYVSKGKNYCRQSLSLKTQQLALYDATSKILSGIGDINVNVASSSSKIAETEKLALVNALKVAQAKAAALAGHLNVKLGGVLEVSENINNYGYAHTRSVKQFAMAEDNAMEQLTLDPVTIRAELVYRVAIADQ